MIAPLISVMGLFPARRVERSRRGRGHRPDYGSYSSSVAVDGSTLHYKRTYEIKEVTVPPEKLESFRDFMRQISADERQSAVLRKVAN